MLNKMLNTKFPLLKKDGDPCVTRLKCLTITAKGNLRKHDN